MSFGGGDLTPLLIGAANPGTGGVGFRQGVVVSWDQNTAANTINVGGTELSNLPILNTSEAVTLSPGDVVGLLTITNQFFILGRLTIPATTAAATALALDRTVASYDTNSTATSSGSASGTSPTVDVLVGKTGRLMVTVGCQIDATGAIAVTSSCGGAMGFALSGANTMAAGSDLAVVERVVMQVSTGTCRAVITRRGSITEYLFGLNPGLTTVTAQYWSTDAPTSASFADRTLIAVPF